MAVKHICDVCGSDDLVIRCVSAECDLCERHHVEFHDHMRETQNRLMEEYDDKRVEILELLKPKDHDNVVRFN